jgi:hypothetical protein
MTQWIIHVCLACAWLGRAQARVLKVLLFLSPILSFRCDVGDVFRDWQRYGQVSRVQVLRPQFDGAHTYKRASV